MEVSACCPFQAETPLESTFLLKEQHSISSRGLPVLPLPPTEQTILFKKRVEEGGGKKTTAGNN